MAIKFAVRGTSLTAYKHSGSGSVGLVESYDNSGNVPVLASDGGAIGGSIIQCYNAAKIMSLAYPGFSNASLTGILSILARVTTNYTGSPASTSALFAIQGPSLFGNLPMQGISIVHKSTGQLSVLMSNPAGGNVLGASGTDVGAWSPTAGTYYDICITWDGTTTANKIVVYKDAVQLGTTTSSVTWPSAQQNQTSIIFGGAWNNIFNSFIKLNEFVVWDSVIDPTSGGLNLNGNSRSSFVTVSGVLDPNASTDPGISNVRNGTGYQISGSSLTGTAAIPSASNVKSGVAIDATTGSLVSTDPGAANVRASTAYTIESSAKTGTAAIPAAANVRFGVAIDNTTGTYTSVNTLQLANLIGQAPVGTAQTSLYMSIGDDIALTLRALAGLGGSPVDLTGASFSTAIKAADGSTVTMDNTRHTADPDQVNNKGVFLCRIPAASSNLLGVGTKKEVVTTVTLSGVVVSYHGPGLLTVLSNVPQS